MIRTRRSRAVGSGKAPLLALLMALLMALSLLGATRDAEAAAPSSKAFSWGYNSDGELGNGTSGTGTETNTPGAVIGLTNVKSMKAGCYHGLALLKSGAVRAWGYNEFGQLGNGTNTYSDVPVNVKNLTHVKAISAGCSHNLALKEDGTVWAWGYNYHGELGNGTSGDGTDSNVPVKVGSLGTGTKGIAAGYDFSLATLKDGTVKSWGNNYYGQLGNGTSGLGTETNTPGAVTGLTNVKAIATDSYAQHALALLNNGTVRAWGYNDSGQLGDGTSGAGADRTTPVVVANLTNVKSVATGGYHSLALLGSGKVKSWGYNGDGELGNGTNGPGTDRSTPGNVIGLSNVRSVSGGTYHSLAVLKNGEARSWGYNYYGELGNGTNGSGTNSDVPVNVKNLTNVKNIDGGEQFTLAATE